MLHSRIQVHGSCSFWGSIAARARGGCRAHAGVEATVHNVATDLLRDAQHRACRLVAPRAARAVGSRAPREHLSDRAP